MKCIDCGQPITGSTIPVVVHWGQAPTLPHLGRKIAEARCIPCDDKRRGKTAKPSTGDVRTPATALPSTKATKTSPKSSSPASSSKFHGGERIYRIVKKNPRKEGTWGWKSFQLIKDGMTVDQYIKAGGRKNDLQWDVDHKFVELKEK
jgi:hypothetical protein